MLLIPRSVTTDTSNGITLTPGNSLWVKAGARIMSGQEGGVFAQNGGAYTIRIEGQVMGLGANGVEIDEVNFQHKHVVTISAAGRVVGANSAVSVYGKALSLTNNGVLEGEQGVYFYSSVATSSATIINRGTILAARYGIENGSVGTFVLLNTGRIVSYGSNSYTGDNGADRVVNSGLMVGDVGLYGGDDLYDGRGGRVVGLIDGGDGSDRFILGAAADKISGGDGIDTVVFSGRIGVRVALDGSFANGGGARGDQFEMIENLVGTVAGDTLLGDAGANLLYGGRGNDRIWGGLALDRLLGGTGADTLLGSDGDDRLVGQTGQDVLTGGLGADYFVLAAPSAGADRFTDFSTVDDHILLLTQGFGYAAAPTGTWFESQASNRAQEADDRLIFRTTDATLWWDADGRGRKAPVLLAYLPKGLALTESHFIFGDLN